MLSIILPLAAFGTFTLAQEDNGFDGPIFPTAPVGATEWRVGTTNAIRINTNGLPDVEFTNLTIEWCTGSDAEQPVLATVYEGAYPTSSPFSVDFEQPSVKDVQYPYGQRYFFKFTSTVADGTLRYNWTTRYWVLPAQGDENDGWPNVGAWEGEFEGPVDPTETSTTSTSTTTTTTTTSPTPTVDVPVSTDRGTPTPTPTQDPTPGPTEDPEVDDPRASAPKASLALGSAAMALVAWLV